MINNWPGDAPLRSDTFKEAQAAYLRKDAERQMARAAWYHGLVTGVVLTAIVGGIIMYLT